MCSIDRLIELQDEKLQSMEKDFDDDLHVLSAEFDEERTAIQAQHSKERRELEALVAVVETEEAEKVRLARTAAKACAAFTSPVVCEPFGRLPTQSMNTSL